MKRKISADSALKKTIFSLVAFFFQLFCGFSQNLYFESPVPLTEKNSLFPVTVSVPQSSYLFYEEVQGSELFINCLEKKDLDSQWSEPKKIAGPFEFSGEVPDIYSAAGLEDGTVCVAVSESQYEIGIYLSQDGGQNFSSSRLSMFSRRLVAPRLFKTKNGSFVLFASIEEENRFSIVYSLSKDGTYWSEFEFFSPAQKLESSFSPCICPVPQGDLVVFQSHFSVPNQPKTFQLYTALSSDNLKNFGEPRLLTDDSAALTRKVNSFVNFSNQSPVLYSKDGQVWCAWERSEVRSENSSIALTRISPEDGKLTGQKRVREYSEQKKSHRPVFFDYDGILRLLWFDDTNGAFTASQISENTFGSEKVVKESRGAAFVQPLITSTKEISYIWQNRQKEPQIYIVSPDKFVLAPVLKPVNFTENLRSRKDKIKIRLTLPEDTSGIAGYSWSFSKSPEEHPSRALSDVIVEKDMSSSRSYTVTATAPEDGQYYFKAIVLDAAGNWSKPAEISYFHDITPPQKVEIQPVKKDSFGFAEGNSITINWQKNPEDSDVAGYSWRFSKVRELDSKFKNSILQKSPDSFQKKQEILQYIKKIEEDEEKLIQKSPEPPEKILQTKNSITCKNYRFLITIHVRKAKSWCVLPLMLHLFRICFPTVL